MDIVTGVSNFPNGSVAAGEAVVADGLASGVLVAEGLAAEGLAAGELVVPGEHDVSSVAAIIRHRQMAIIFFIFTNIPPK